MANIKVGIAFPKMFEMTKHAIIDMFVSAFNPGSYKYSKYTHTRNTSSTAVYSDDDTFEFDNIDIDRLSISDLDICFQGTRIKELIDKNDEFSMLVERYAAGEDVLDNIKEFLKHYMLVDSREIEWIWGETDEDNITGFMLYTFVYNFITSLNDFIESIEHALTLYLTHRFGYSDYSKLIKLIVDELDLQFRRRTFQLNIQMHNDIKSDPNYKNVYSFYDFLNKFSVDSIDYEKSDKLLPKYFSLLSFPDDPNSMVIPNFGVYAITVFGNKLYLFIRDSENLVSDVIDDIRIILDILSDINERDNNNLPKLTKDEIVRLIENENVMTSGDMLKELLNFNLHYILSKLTIEHVL